MFNLFNDFYDIFNRLCHFGKESLTALMIFLALAMVFNIFSCVPVFFILKEYKYASLVSK